MANGSVLAIEGGGSHTRVVLGGEGGGVLREACTGPGSALYTNPETFPRKLAQLINDVRFENEPARIGCAGPMRRELVAKALQDALPGVPVRWYSEGEIALGVYGLTWGVTVVAGTGSSSRAATPDGRWIETGGFGPQFDDLGSGYWLAREAVAAVLRAEHGRGPETALRKAVFRHFQITDAWDLVPLCEGNGHLSVPWVAGLAAAVAEHAEAGDAVAKNICAAAGAHLGDLVVASARRAAMESLKAIPVVPTGGVFRAKLVVHAFAEALRASGIDFELRMPVPDPVIGLLNLLARG